MNNTIKQLQHGGFIEGVPSTCQLSTEEFEAPFLKNAKAISMITNNESRKHEAEAHGNFRVRYLYDCDAALKKQLRIPLSITIMELKH